MCIIHDLTLHHIFQNIMESFEQSKMLSVLFLRRVGCLMCTCKKEIYYDSKTIFATQRALYQWFDDSLKDPRRPALAVERLTHFKTVVDEFRTNGCIDSGTKITFLSLLRDVDSLNFSELRRLAEEMNNKKKSSKRNLFLLKIVKLKFDLSLCSAKEFTELINKIDNCAIKYIQVTNKCKITLRDAEHLTLRHFMGQVDATIEASSEKNLNRAELSLKRLADAVHYRLVKQLPSCDTMSNFSNKNTIGTYNHVKVLLQSPPAHMTTSQLSSLNESKIDLSSSMYSQETTSYATTDVNNTTSSSINKKVIKKTAAKSKSKAARESVTSTNSTLNGNNNSDDSFLNLSHNSMGTTTPLTSSPMSSSSNHSPFKFKIKTVTKKAKSPSQQQNEKDAQLPKVQMKSFKSPYKASLEPRENFYTSHKFTGYNSSYQNDKEYNYNSPRVIYNSVDRSPYNAIR